MKSNDPYGISVSQKNQKDHQMGLEKLKSNVDEILHELKKVSCSISKIENRLDQL